MVIIIIIIIIINYYLCRTLIYGTMNVSSKYPITKNVAKVRLYSSAVRCVCAMPITRTG